MDAIPYYERIRLAERIPYEGQAGVISRIPQFGNPECFNLITPPQETADILRAAVFNVEHGTRIREILSFLSECPELRDADILFGNELDDGTERSRNLDASREIAEALGFNYAYALEFIELVNPNDRKGYEGNTLFSRWPIVRAESLYLPEGYNWFFDSQKRIGTRVALFCELDIAGRRIGAVCVHLENRTSPTIREAQCRAVFGRAAELFGEMPILIGGDFNTNAFDYSEAAALEAYRRQQSCGIITDPTQRELLFTCAEQMGFEYRSLNGERLPTRRRPTGGGVLTLHLDWIFGRGVTCVRHGMVSTVLSDCDWARPDSPLREAELSELSDHNAVWADIRI